MPSKRISPDSGRCNLLRQLKRVVLPAPLGPINPVILPRGTSNCTRSSATTPSKRAVRDWIERRAGIGLEPDEGHQPKSREPGKRRQNSSTSCSVGEIITVDPLHQIVARRCDCSRGRSSAKRSCCLAALGQTENEWIHVRGADKRSQRVQSAAAKIGAHPLHQDQNRHEQQSKQKGRLELQGIVRGRLRLPTVLGLTRHQPAAEATYQRQHSERRCHPRRQGPIEKGDQNRQSRVHHPAGGENASGEEVWAGFLSRLLRKRDGGGCRGIGSADQAGDEYSATAAEGFL